MKKVLFFIIISFCNFQTFSQCACCAGAGVGSSNNNFNNVILTLPKKTWIAEAYGDFRTIKDGPIASHQHESDEKLLKNMFITTMGLRYGISDKITLSMILPYVFLQTDSGNDKGLGDLILMGTFNVYSKNNLNFAIQGGLELPTGIQKNSNFDNSTVIVGSGSYDPMLGISFSKKWNNKLSLQGGALYKQTTKGYEGNYYGNLSVQNLGLSYQIKGENNFCSINKLNEKQKSKFGLSIFGAYYGEWLEKLKENNISDQNSGYYLGFMNLGTTLTLNTWAFPFTFSLPIINKVNGDQNKAGYRLRIGIVKSF